LGKSPANPLPGDLIHWLIHWNLIRRNPIRRNAAATGTRHELGCLMGAAVDKAVDVLEKTVGAIAFHDRASHCVHDLIVRRSRRLSGRDPCLSPLRERQHNERPSGVH
jgi:hypothetical protein